MSEETTTSQPETPRRRTWSDAQRASHAASRARRQGRSGTDPELVAEEVVAEAVANITTAALMFVVPVAPHVGFTIAGVPHPDEPQDRPPQRWIVQSRAVIAGQALLEHAQRNPRILAAVHRFNLLFQNVALLEAAGAVVAAAAVDAHLAPPDAVVVLPGGIRYPIFAPVIGDTIAYVAEMAGLRQQAASVDLNGRPAAEREHDEMVVAGGVEAT